MKEIKQKTSQGAEYEDVPSPLLPKDLPYLQPTGSPHILQVVFEDDENDIDRVDRDGQTLNKCNSSDGANFPRLVIGF